MNIQDQTIINRCKENFTSARQNIMAGIRDLWDIRERELWKGTADSFAEFVQLDLKLNVNRASEMLAVWRHYVIDGGLPAVEVQEAELQNLYKARNLPEPVEEQLEIARNNSTRDIQKRLKTDNQECEHTGEIIQICADCRAKI